MGTKLIYILVALNLVAITSCHKLCVPRKFSFTGGVASVVPDKDSIHIGDTLWFSCSLPLNYKYLGGNSDSISYNLAGATNVETDIHLTTLTAPNELIGAMDSFLFVVKKGAIKLNALAPHAAQTIFFIEQNGDYIFSLGIIPLKKAIYCMTVIDIYQAMKNCDKVSVTITTNNSDNHLHYLRDIYYGGGAIYPIDSTHSYCFKVY